MFYMLVIGGTFFSDHHLFGQRSMLPGGLRVVVRNGKQMRGAHEYLVELILYNKATND